MRDMTRQKTQGLKKDLKHLRMYLCVPPPDATFKDVL